MDLARIYRHKFRLLVSVYAVLKNGSITRAAEVLHVAQPAVSKHLNEVSGWSGLFTRQRHGVKPTAKGAALMPAIEQLMTLSDQVFTAIENGEVVDFTLDVFSEDAAKVNVLEAENAALKAKLKAVRMALDNPQA